MPNARLKVPFLFGGISTQPPHVRKDEQVEDAVNALFSVFDGCRKRPGIRAVAAVTGLTASGNYRIHTISRDAVERYIVVYGEGVVRIFDTDGAEVTTFTSTEAAAYLALESPTADDLRLSTVADFTFILNTLVEVAAKTSDAFTVTGVHSDFDAMISTLPASETYHKAQADTEVQPAGYFKYLPTAENNGFAYRLFGATNTSWGDVNGSWNDATQNPVGFKVTFRDRDAVDHVYDVLENFYENPANSMADIALRFQRKLQAAGATDALVNWTPTGAQVGKFTIVSPYRGTGAAVQAIANTTGTGQDITNAAGEPFNGGTATAGTGDPATQTQPVLSRWERVPGPSQPEAELDASTMPVQMRRLKAPYYEEAVEADAPFAYFRLGESSGTVAVNETGSNNGTYGASIGLGQTGALTGDTNTAVRLGTNPTLDNVTLGTQGSLGSSWQAANAGAFEFWIKTTQTGTTIIGGNGVETDTFNITLNPIGASTSGIGFTISDGTNTLTGRTGDIGLNNGAYHHVAINFKLDATSTVTIYVDGVSQSITHSSQQTVTGIGNFTTNLFFGQSFLTTLDEPEIYTAQLTAKQVEDHYKRGANATLFDIDVVDWGFRETGDEDTNPVPSLWKDGVRLADISFHRNRLLLVGDENNVFSQAGAFFDFYIANANNIGDADPIDVALSSDEVTLVDFVSTFDKSLLIFTKTNRQFELNAPEALTPSTAAITPSTSYASQSVRPVVMGNRVYFAGSELGSSKLYEYHNDQQDVRSSAEDVSAHVLALLPTSVRSIAGSTNNGVVFVLGESTHQIFIYQTFYDGPTKKQSAWSRMDLDPNERFADMGVIDNDLWLLVELEAGGYVLERLPIGRQPAETDWLYDPHLDHSLTLTGSYNAGPNETTWTQPFADSTLNRIVLGPDFGANNGLVLFPTRVNSTQVKATGNYSAGPAVLGRLYTMTVELTRPFVKQAGAGGVGLVNLEGVTIIRQWITLHRDTGGYQLFLEYPGRGARSKSLDLTGTENGQLTMLGVGDAAAATLKIIADKATPAIVTTVEYLCDYVSRSR